MKREIEEVIQTLNPDERAILPYLEEGDLGKIADKSDLDKTKVFRALQFMSNKGILKLKTEEKQIVDLGDNGVYYKKHGLPERKLLNIVAETAPIDLDQSQKQAKLSKNEFKAALGVLKKKALISLANGKLI